MTGRANRFYSAFEDYLSGSLLFFGLSLIMFNVIMRYCFNASKSAYDEFSAYFIVWGTMIGIAVALRDNYHIKVDLLFIQIPLRIRRWVSVLAHLISLTFGLIYTYYGIQLVNNYLTSGQGSDNTRFPLWIVYLIMPISGLMFNFRLLQQLYRHLKNGGAEWLQANGGEA
ncbi:MAG: TRAP transporter small permease [Deltaproteobacteria bacterium]|nr:TRAP transporter small permease [Deltaproteobacteria bacterium]